MTTLSSVMEKYEKFIAGFEIDELYIFRAMNVERKGQDMLLEKIDKKIIYEENRPKSTAEALAPYMNPDLQLDGD